MPICFSHFYLLPYKVNIWDTRVPTTSSRAGMLSSKDLGPGHTVVTCLCDSGQVSERPFRTGYIHCYDGMNNLRGLQDAGTSLGRSRPWLYVF